ncbi:MAG: hypothetical protein HN736_13850 [Anaerolineae bacterium]|jgi:hypothetical protein|nr:hypothetical protein [Anaerolineae bacterium]MBT4312174.1 hypothetical protein [Anaerolineae bacterium]MBT4457074.1 hypothetical protein [Anaerolineae bacterium]MBT4843729.1 hypothetical protein [Anaerolineae bacterium]MBT6063154.1 hypothetical protein [Anaerolineae bacterium]
MGKFLRFIGILFMGLTSALILLSGVGTTCVALDATQYEGMEAIAQYQWLYIIYVLAFVAFGIMGIRATIALVRGKENAYRDSIIVLVLSLVIGIIHMATSRALREGGSSMPLDFIVYAVAFTLIIFLLFGVPKIKQMVGFEDGESNGKTAAGGMTAIVMGMLFLSVQMWAGPTHIFDGVNLADAFHSQMMIGGGILFVVGLGMFVYAALNSATVSEALPQESSLSA